MADAKQIPLLLKLLDDDSPQVQDQIIRQLFVFAPVLKKELKSVLFTLNSNQRKCLDQVFQQYRNVCLKKVWPSWFVLTNDYDRLEKALTILSEYLTQGECEGRLSLLLDSLADEYTAQYKTTSAKWLAHFLFKMKKLKGDEEDYYNPQNSNLIHVIRRKKGIPISLASIYMLVGRRLGLEIEGCHFPGHFLTRIYCNGRRMFVDCFNGGQMLEEKDIVYLQDNIFDGIDNILAERADAKTMVRRFLANIIHAYQLQEDETLEPQIELFKELDMWVVDSHIANLHPNDLIQYRRPLFNPGHLVRHKKLGYRGIIVEVDETGLKMDQWQPGSEILSRRSQPWYHVLVDGSDQATYVAQNNLTRDSSNKIFNHPLVSYFFNQAGNGEYIRNENPWPDADF